MANIPRGHVVSMSHERVTVNLGFAHGVEPRGSIEVATSEGSIVLPVRAVDQAQAFVSRPYGVAIEVGAAARLTTARPTYRRIAPPERLSFVSLEARLFGLISVRNGGGGVAGELIARWRTQLPIALQLRLAPMGTGFGDMGSVPFGHGELVTSLDTRLFELGFAIGGTFTEREEDFSFDSVFGFGTSVGALMRLGAKDGLHGELTMTYAWTGERFEWVHARFEGQVPFSRRIALVVTGSGGFTRIGMGAVGLRILLFGDGGSGSLYLTPYLGGAGMLIPGRFDAYVGPLFGFGVERRY